MSSAPPVDLPFARSLPKIELHAHLTGSISRACLHDIWEARRQQEPQLELEDPLVAIPPGKVDYDVQTYGLVFSLFHLIASAPSDMPFFPLFSSYIYKLCDNLPSVEFSTKRVLEDFQADGVVYVEFRTTPRAIPSRGITKDDYVKTILDVLRTHNEQDRNNMRAFLILSIDRRNTAAEAQEVVDLALKYKNEGVVGVDLCGNPARGDISLYTDAFAQVKAARMKITLHFAEIAESGTDDELNTLLSWQPDRLGHVIHVNSSFQERIEKENIGVELCLSCNVHAKLITGTYSDHHFGFWRQTGVPVALCTDDVGVFCSPLSQEYYLAAVHFGLDRAQLTKLAQRPIASIFTEAPERERLEDIFRHWSS